MTGVPTGVIAATGLLGGYAVARWTKKRPLGGVALAAAGVVAAKGWRQKAGNATAAALSGAYVVAFVGSHPLAKKIGAWPSVGAVAGGLAAASWAVVDRRQG
ncbi:hypothetical protein GCM10012285_49560 [Streptomyces kronopolitis]|uniref:Uncharacterized protein n=1 Tax=Streptomyces kronopolitis TaxID=1612435 RepID=A0ABQ2JV95_9ACTN|nr:hypothetical protein [Streptomyces kronopolitis]GGN55628.1 hypothetical protein GCM10012285_49560 [Streptomyces kronopolitis]